MGLIVNECFEPLKGWTKNLSDSLTKSVPIFIRKHVLKAIVVSKKKDPQFSVRFCSFFAYRTHTTHSAIYPKPKLII